MESEQSIIYANEIQTFIVIPCYNEESNLFATCASLGFGIGEELTPHKTILIIIDNNSRDNTVLVSEQVKLKSRKDSVIIEFEKEQGIVPARHKGNLIARDVAKQFKYELNNILILQADADTIYPERYIYKMRDAIIKYGENVLIESCISYDPKFLIKNAFYFELCSDVDNKSSFIINDDFIVDDKVAGYRLSDYFFWGCHLREYTLEGDEIYAETSRLLIKASGKNAKRIRVDQFPAYHSTRRLIENPILHFISCGFPRETEWINKWNKNHKTIKIQHFKSGYTKKDIIVRKLHFQALFFILPIHIAITKNRQLYKYSYFQKLPPRNIYDILENPGIFIYDAFKFIEPYINRI